jgi:hypothetical protein
MTKIKSPDQMKHAEKVILAIAQANLGIRTLDTRNSDALDFHTVAVWQIRAALQEAYAAGQSAAKRRGTARQTGGAA